MIKVIKQFYDLQDDGYCYNKGDSYPRKGFKATDARIAELAGSKNKCGVALIKVEDPKEETPAKKTKKADKE